MSNSLRKFVQLLWLAAFLVLAILFFYQQKSNKVISATSHDGIDIVTYANCETEIIYNDYDYSHPENQYWTLRTTLDAMTNDDSRSPPCIAPSIILRGNTWQHVVYTYDDPEVPGCQQNILYVDRTLLSNEKFTKIKVPYCIEGTLDIQNFTRFFAISEDRMKVAVGTYVDGAITTTAILPVSGATSVVSNRDNTILAFFSGQCDRNEDTFRVLVWNTISGTLNDKRPDLHLSDCGQISAGELVYNHETDTFDIYNYVDGELKYLVSLE